jgi:hypothetical protein
MPKHLRFNELWLLSEKEGRARRITWAKNATILVGGNHYGKSTVLRTMYQAFGCKTKTLGGEWDPKAVVAVTFSIEDVSYTILRRGIAFGLFDANGMMLWSTKDQSELRSRFSDLVSFVLPLSTQLGDTKQARPAFFFLPLFIDQDGSWGNAWHTFDGLGEFREWQKPTIELMLGIRGSEYWKIFAKLSKHKTDAEDLQREIKVLEDTRKRLSDKFPPKPWFRDAMRFRKELATFEARVSELATRQQHLESQRMDLMNTRETLKSQIVLIETALQEHSSDMRFLDERRADGEMLCPTCGTAHENSFYSRLNLEAEADELRQLRAVFETKLDIIQRKAAEEKEQREKISKEADALERLLEIHRGELKFREIVDRAGANTAHGVLDGQSESVIAELSGIEKSIAALEKLLEELKDPQRSKVIGGRFKELYLHFATTLEVPPSLMAQSRGIQQKPSGGGSGGPCSVLAYHFALAHTAEEFSNGCLPPLVVDSPHQQAPDEIRRPQVTEFIFKNRPADQQLIVGLEDPPPESIVLGPDDKRIDLSEKFKLLIEDDYVEVFNFLEPRWRAMSAVLDSVESVEP